MPLYTFFLCGEDEQPYTSEACECSQDAEAYRVAGELLGRHSQARSVTVCAGENPVLSCHRQMPFIRAVGAFHARAKLARL